jgi:hypothetical protein
MNEAFRLDKVCIEDANQTLMEEKELKDQGTSSEVINSKIIEFDELMKQAEAHKDTADDFASTLDERRGYKD